ncbi:iron-containing alcohol dehydrogenase [Sinorhizobium meliloti]|uniref:iron-containing alcohol dehydrogenase n=1 Tax=Rhizobium meliloti TaxID=382 RepID=UPI003F5CE719
MDVTKTDCGISFGGGSTTGLGKSIALRTGVPQITIPTTYAGSEVTPILGQTENGPKTTLRDVAILPNVVIYDPELTVWLPKQMTNWSEGPFRHLIIAVRSPQCRFRSNPLAKRFDQSVTGVSKAGNPELRARPSGSGWRYAQSAGADQSGRTCGRSCRTARRARHFPLRDRR